MDLRSERQAATTVIHIDGELDPHNSRSLELYAAEVLDEEGLEVLAVDCSGVTHLGSHGLAALVEVARVAADRSATVQIVRPSPVVVRLVELAGLHRLLASADPPAQPSVGLRTGATG